MRADPIDLSTATRTGRRSTGERLREAVLALAGGHGDVLLHSETAWASITFTGTRHRLRIAFEGDEAVAGGEELVAALPEHEFAIPRQLVADAAVCGVESRLVPEVRMVVECELLLLEDA
ncbi:hypothetical protein LY632_06145 [Erythrobacter sp. SDW2]|uniref:hypothetical protein n=1 Tax=Erythrobacter sp. SDW2 TaxID=2907154 RepID=UPI001F396822|nr:hypothetical protein [Erythrobacter sp. SDW2]UIP07977.1 hypothetical protein LY632_06145 [Erythrobacter sp. SDW2]